MKSAERERRRLLANLQKQKIPTLETKYINPNVAKTEDIIFSFLYLNMKRGKFTCRSGDGQKLINVLEDLKKHSGYNLENIGVRKNNHFIPQDQIYKHNLVDLLSLSNKLFQLGSKHQSERVIGFFESNRSNVFQVCILDLAHQLSE